MDDFDLVPAGYRDQRRFRRHLRRIVIGYRVLVLVLVLLRSLLEVGLRSESSQIERLQADKSDMLNEKARMDELYAQRRSIDEKLNMLNGLRGGVPARAMFQALDRALNGKVWLQDWKFLRAGEYVPAEARSVQRGYFIVVPKGEKKDTGQAWRMETHMSIRAKALDHTALADFVGRLSRQPAIEDVKVLNTRSSSYSGFKVVDFDLAVVVNGQAELERAG